MENPDSETLTLLKMPVDVLVKILESVDYCGIVTLRKTCHDLRNLIDDVKPDPATYTLDIKVKSHKIRVDFLSHTRGHYRLLYTKEGNGCFVKNSFYPGNMEHFEDRNFVDAFIDDFKIFLKLSESQKVPIVRLEFVIKGQLPQFFEKIKEFGNTLKTNSVWMRFPDETEACAILNLTSSGFLETIDIENSPYDPHILQMTKLPSMKQWKQAVNVQTNRLDIWSPEYLLHFRNIIIMNIDLSPQSAVLMKETFLKSPNFEVCRFSCWLEDGVFDAIGSYPLIDEDKYGRPRRKWCFKNPGIPEKALLIETTGIKLMCFSSINLTDAPGNVEIRD